jgi:hypothetical protein
LRAHPALGVERTDFGGLCASLSDGRLCALPKRSLARLRDLRGQGSGSGFVFTSRDKGNVLRRYYKALKRAGLPQVRFHSLRVTSNSLLIELGADPVEIAARMGHTTTRMTLDVYGRLFNDRQGRLAELMDRAFAQLPPTTAGDVPVVSHPSALKRKEPRRSAVLLAMETGGLEPPTSCLQSRRSTS